MKRLQMTVTVHLEEVEPNSDHPLDKVSLASGSTRRSLDNHFRSLPEKELKKILVQEGVQGLNFVLKEMIEKTIPWPLTETKEEKITRIKNQLQIKWPNLYFAGTIPINSGGKFSIYQITIKGNGREQEIVHPHNPRHTITTRYLDTFCKLEDGRWVNVYQGMEFYNEVVEEVVPPVTEEEIKSFFKNIDVPFVIEQFPISELPLTKEDEE